MIFFSVLWMFRVLFILIQSALVIMPVMRNSGVFFLELRNLLSAFRLSKFTSRFFNSAAG